MSVIDRPYLETTVARHYTAGPILERIREGLRAAGVDPDRPAPADLKPVDEFHTGGSEATEALLEPLGITRQTRVLDLGSGIGGTARFIADRYGASVTGIDLTPAFVETATELSRLAGLGDQTAFQTGSVLDLALDGPFDLATMFHVGMNIADKPRLFAQVARVLTPGGRFALFDIMRGDRGQIGFPVPWASEAEASFVEPPAAYRAAAKAAGLTLTAERDRSDYARGFFQKVIAATDADGPPPVGLHLIMGDTAAEKYGNAVKAAMDGATAPWEMVFQKP